MEAHEQYENAYERRHLDDEVEAVAGIGNMTYNGNIIDELEEDSDDIFNEKITDKIDALNLSERKKSEVLDQLLVSPDKLNAVAAGLSEQGTSAGTLLSKVGSAMTNTNESGKTAIQTTLIDTCQGGGGASATRAFDSGLGGSNEGQQRIDLSNLIDDEMSKPSQ